LIIILEKKAWKKFYNLRNDFIFAGTLSKAKTIAFLQIISYIKQLRHFVSGTHFLKSKEQLFDPASAGDSQAGAGDSQAGAGLLQQSWGLPAGDSALPRQNKRSQDVSLLGEPRQQFFEGAMQQRLAVISQKLANVQEEYRKIKFIEYLKGIVKKYRQENIYFYLSTIADSRKELRNIQKYTKKHSALFFAYDSLPKKTDMQKQIQKTLIASLSPREAKAMLAQFQLRDIEKYRRIFQKNCELTPKISIQFYSAPADIIETKATMVVDSIVDALEKRQAFRKIIKTAMSTAMKNVRVKGIKIQLAGRLNGAEIARTEWVRSGRVPLQTLTANIDYSYKTASTIYGILGIKVWIFKGYTKDISAELQKK
jgi:ribosomal protein S3